MSTLREISVTHNLTMQGLWSILDPNLPYPWENTHYNTTKRTETHKLWICSVRTSLLYTHWVVPLHGCFPGCLAWTSQWFIERWLPDNFNVVPQVAELVDLPRWARVYLKRVQLITLFRLDSAVNKQTKLGGSSHCTDEVFDLNQHLLSHISWVGHVLVASTKPGSQCEPKRRIWTWPSPNVERREEASSSPKNISFCEVIPNSDLFQLENNSSKNCLPGFMSVFAK